jgi:hypothetical protein
VLQLRHRRPLPLQQGQELLHLSRGHLDGLGVDLREGEHVLGIQTGVALLDVEGHGVEVSDVVQGLVYLSLSYSV